MSVLSFLVSLKTNEIEESVLESSFFYCCVDNEQEKDEWVDREER